MNQGADGQDTFNHDADFAQFETLLGHSVERTGVRIHAYCLMTNHFHLVAEAGETAVSDFMQTVQSPYVLGHNRRNERTGPLFRSRYTAVHVTDPRQLATLGRYVHRNPLSFVPRRALANYRWSSYGVYTGLRQSPSWLSVETLVDAAGTGAGIDRYRAFVETDLPSDTTDPRRWALPPRATLVALDRAVSNTTGVEESELLNASVTRNQPARTVAVMLAVELRLADAAKIADRYGFSSPAAARTLARRGRIRVANEPAFALLRARVLMSLPT